MAQHLKNKWKKLLKNREKERDGNKGTSSDKGETVDTAIAAEPIQELDEGSRMEKMGVKAEIDTKSGGMMVERRAVVPSELSDEGDYIVEDDEDDEEEVFEFDGEVRPHHLELLEKYRERNEGLSFCIICGEDQGKCKGHKDNSDRKEGDLEEGSCHPTGGRIWYEDVLVGSNVEKKEENTFGNTTWPKRR